MDCLGMDWNEIVRIIELNRLELFGRSEEGEAQYQKNTQKIIQQYGSVSQYIYDVKLFSLRQEIKLFGKEVPLEKDSSVTRPRVLLVQNDFPYFVKPSIKHHLIWSMVEWKDPSAIRSFLEHHIPNHRHAFFVNPMHLRSIKDIFHIHVFSEPLVLPLTPASLD